MWNTHSPFCLLSFYSSLFKPGDYLLTLEGLTAQDGPVPVAAYAFRVLTKY
jgi:hypothetical protein